MHEVNINKNNFLNMFHKTDCAGTLRLIYINVPKKVKEINLKKGDNNTALRPLVYYQMVGQENCNNYFNLH